MCRLFCQRLGEGPGALAAVEAAAMWATRPPRATILGSKVAAPALAPAVLLLPRVEAFLRRRRLGTERLKGIVDLEHVRIVPDLLGEGG
jgi:hypothetical protein